jgi:uncharacterized protein
VVPQRVLQRKTYNSSDRPLRNPTFADSEKARALKFQPETLDGVNTIARHDAGRIVVGATPYERSVVVPWVGAVRDWPVPSPEALEPAHLEALIELRPELVILGTGRQLRFPPAALLRPLIERRIGFECMDTAAACRTYNVLVTERRSVVAALILQVGSAPP